MAGNKAFIDLPRNDFTYLPPSDRIRDYNLVEEILLSPEQLADQAARCSDCGISYCQGNKKDSGQISIGCPVDHDIARTHALIRRGDLKGAWINLSATNNFPEFTGAVCPAPCENACTHNIYNAAVTIRMLEQWVAGEGLKNWFRPQPPEFKTGYKIAIVGSGPAGMACAQQLARRGHDVHLLEQNANGGGLLRYGIPDFKLAGEAVDRRLEQMAAEGVSFYGNTRVGSVDFTIDRLLQYDAVVLATGSEVPKDHQAPGRDLSGIHFAMDFLTQQNRRNNREPLNAPDILATDRDVVLIGLGDTSSDCAGTAARQGARSVTNITHGNPLPELQDMSAWPYVQKTNHIGTSHEEAGTNFIHNAAVTRYLGENGRVTGLECVKVNDLRGQGGGLEPVAGSEFRMAASLVLLGIGYASPRPELPTALNLVLNKDGTVKAPTGSYLTSQPKIYAAGDARRGQSLVVWAIREGRMAAAAVDRDWVSRNPELSAARADYPQGARAAWLARTPV
ncbi:MAG: glutamate synthase subunit beta [Bdellovibrionales bacterium]